VRALTFAFQKLQRNSPEGVGRPRDLEVPDLKSNSASLIKASIPKRAAASIDKHIKDEGTRLALPDQKQRSNTVVGTPSVATLVAVAAAEVPAGVGIVRVRAAVPSPTQANLSIP
jgi:hypothetical protein